MLDGRSHSYGPDPGRTAVFTGEDERFAYKRARAAGCGRCVGRGGGRSRNPDGGSRCLYRSRWEMPAGEPSSTASIDQASYGGSDLTVEGAKGEGMGNLGR